MIVALSPSVIGGGSVILLLIALMARMPIGIALGAVSMVGTYALMGPTVAFGILAEMPYEFAAHWTLSSIPMFLLMGFVCFRCGLTTSIFNLARMWLYRLPGGLAVSTVGGAALFSAVTGSSLACAAAMGRIAIPEMLSRRYAPALATGTVAAAGTIGSLIPPSIPLLIYGLLVEQPVGKLFLAAVFPGVLTALLYAGTVVGRCLADPSLAPVPATPPTREERLAAIREIWPFILLLVGVFGGLFAGVFTPTEAGAAGASLSILIAALRRTLNWESFRSSVIETIESTATIFLIGIGAQIFTRFLALSGLPEAMTDTIQAAGFGQFEVIFMISLLLLVLGMFLDPIGILLLATPLVTPLLEAVHIDLIWFGVFLIKWIEVGLLTPPVGMNVFVVKGVVGPSVPIETIFRGIVWFLLADVIVLTSMIFIPELCLWLPSLAG
jgi:tripartite ATP-independent transporter DctM subunit